MSKKIIVCITVLLFSGLIYAKGAFVEVGDPSFFPDDVRVVSLKTAENGNLFLLYFENASLNLSMAVFDGNIWKDLGSRRFSGKIGFLNNNIEADFDISGNDTPYVVFSLWNSHLVTVMKFDGNDWVDVGERGFSNSFSTFPSIAVNSKRVPYVAFGDCTSSCEEEGGYIGQILPLSTMKFNGNEWDFVGEPMFTKGGVEDISITFDSDDTPFISFNEWGLGAVKFNGSAWEYIDSQNSHEFSGDLSSIIIDDSDNIYVGSTEGIVKFDGNDWKIIFENVLRVPSFSIDKDNNVYTAYTSFSEATGNKEKISVKKCLEENCEILGNEFFAEAHYPSISIDISGACYVAFGNGEKQIELMKYDPEAGETPDDSDDDISDGDETADDGINDDDTAVDENSTADEETASDKDSIPVNDKDSGSSGCTMVVM